MPGAKQTAKQKRSSGSGQRRKVLHVSDFQDLYELADDVRKERSGPLRYTKSLVTLSPFCQDAESRHFERMRRMKARPERHLLRSIFEDLKNWTGSKPYGSRGYLITAEGKAASSEYLAEQLSVSVDEIEKALPVLEHLGFLERIPMNSQAEPEKPKQKPAGAKCKTVCAKPAKKSKQNRKAQNTAKHNSEASIKEVPESVGSSRTEPESVCPPSRKDKSKSKSKIKDKPRPSASDKDKRTRGIATPMKPTPSDAEGSRALSPAPPGSAYRGNEPVHISNALNTIRRRCNQAAIQAGREIYSALGAPYAEGSADAAREVGCFASQFESALSCGLGPGGLVKFWESMVKEAGRLQRLYSKNGGYKSAAKVWVTIFGKKLASAQQRSPP